MRNKQCATIAEIKDEPEHVVERASTLIASTGNERKALKASYSFANNTWIIDSGATVHMTFEYKLIRNIRPSTQIDVTTTDGDVAPILGRVWHPFLIISTLILFSWFHHLFIIYLMWLRWKYTLDLLQETVMSACQPVITRRMFKTQSRYESSTSG